MKKFGLAAAVVLVLFLGVHVVMAGSNIEVRSSLSGDVTWTAAVGTQVYEGSEIVRVSTLTGEAVAARAVEGGTVSDMMVRPGDKVFAGQVVARITK